PRRAGGAESRMAATLRKQSASATLDPPNLCTTQGAGLSIEAGLYRRARGCAMTACAPAASGRARAGSNTAREQRLRVAQEPCDELLVVAYAEHAAGQREA